MSLYYLNVTIHLLAALFWLGGMFFLAVVGAPTLRRVEPAVLRAELFRRLGESFRLSGWIALAALVGTGLLNVYFRGMLQAEVLGSRAFWGTPYGQALAWKLFAVAAMLTVSGLHDFVLGPAASRADPESGAGRRLRRRAALLARVNAIFGLIIIIAAVRLARGG
jgi:putative copper resistance protein D